MRFLGRAAAVFAALLLGLALAPTPSFGVESPGLPIGLPIPYGEDRELFGHCVDRPETGSQVTGSQVDDNDLAVPPIDTGPPIPDPQDPPINDLVPFYGSVANERCTVMLPTADPRVPGDPVGYIAASLFNPTIDRFLDRTLTLTIPVELVFDSTGVADGRVETEENSVEQSLLGPQMGTPSVDPNAPFPPDPLRDLALRGFLSVLHGPGATADAPLTLTVTEGSEIASTAFNVNDMLAGLMAIDMRVESNADATVDNQGILLTQVLPVIRMTAIMDSASDLTIRNSGVIAGQRDSNDPDEFLPNRVLGVLVQSFGTGDITIENTGMIRVAKEVHAMADPLNQGYGIHVTSFQSGAIRMTAGGVIEGNQAIRLDLNNAAPVWVQVADEGRVDGRFNGIRINYHPDAPHAGDPSSTCFLPGLEPTYRSCVAVFGTVEADGSPVQDADGNDVTSAAVLIQGGGVLTIGPQGRVEHQTEGQNAVAFEGDGPAAIVYLVQGIQVAGLRDNDDGILGNVEIPEDAAYHALMLPDDVAPAELMDAIEEFHRGDRSEEDLNALLARVRMVNLREEDMVFEDYLSTTTWTYDFEEGHRFDETREIAPRGRVYEALPSVLLSVNRPLSHDDRWNVPRASGWWMWTEAAGGDWEADALTVQEDTAEEEDSFANGAYDYDRYAVEIGLDWAPSESAVLGLSAHYRDIDADIGDSGSIKADGYGAGVSARVSGEKAYFALQGAATWYEVDLIGSGVGALREDLDGFGWSAGAEFGYRLDFGELAVTPRVGATYSEVDVDSFQGPESRVSLEDGESVIGRAGVRVQYGGLYAAVDVEHEFSDDERRVEMAGMDLEDREAMAVLESQAEDTWVRASAGGIHEWGEGRYSLHVRLNYAESGGENDEFSGSLTLQGRF